MRLVVARCSVTYSGRLDAYLPEAVRLLMFKADGSVLVHCDGGGYKPLNWMTAPTAIEEEGSTITVRKVKGEDQLTIALAEVMSDLTVECDAVSGLEKDGVETHLQELLADQPGWCGDGFRLVRREWPTDIGPVDLMCRDPEDAWIAVEIKRVGTIDAVLLETGDRVARDVHVADDLGQRDLELVVAFDLAHRDDVALLLDRGRRRHPVQGLVATGVRVHEHRPVGLDHQQAHRLGQVGVQAAGVGDGAAGDDEAHRTAQASPPAGQIKACATRVPDNHALSTRGLPSGHH